MLDRSRQKCHFLALDLTSASIFSRPYLLFQFVAGKVQSFTVRGC